jgi:uncharacterized protein (UPF0262 family)
MPRDGELTYGLINNGNQQGLSSLTVLLDDSILDANRAFNAAVKQARYNLIQSNTFSVAGGPTGPYHLRINCKRHALIFEVNDRGGGIIIAPSMRLTNSFRKTLQDYVTICEKQYQALLTGTDQIWWAIDTQRTMIHDAAATLVRQRLSRKRIRMDIETARDIVEVIAYLQNELIQ